MKQKIFSIIAALMVIIFLIIVGRFGFTVVSIEDVQAAIQGETFDPGAYIDSIWTSALIPAFEKNAVDLKVILTELEPEADGTTPKDSLVAIANKHGLITVGESHVYMVKGSGTIINVNTETSLGTAEITLDGYNGPIKVLLYIGTRIPSDETSVRDAVGFISFGDFKEQTEYGKVASEINKRILSESLNALDVDNLIGKTIDFKGAFSIRTFNLIQIELKEIKVVPVQITLGE
jgi:predicted lipoprotein